MATTRIQQWFGDETDPATNPPAAVVTTASSGAAPTNGSQMRFRSRDFDQTTDETLHFHFELPATYSSGGTLIIKYFTTLTSGVVKWKTAFVLIHPSSEGSPTDLDAAVFGTVTSAASNTVPATAGQIKEVTFDLGVTGGHPGDELIVMFGRDADDAADTAAGDIRLREPWSLTFTTT